MKIYISFFLFFLLNVNVFSQNIDETIFLGDENFNHGDYSQAIKYYKRVLFFSKDKYIANKRIADSYFKIKEYDFANNYYDSAIVYCLNRKDIFELKFKKADCSIFLKEYNKANKIVSALNIKETNDLFFKKNFYLGIINFAKLNYDSAEIFFIKSVSDTSLYTKEKIHSLFKKSRNLKRPNPKFAGALSVVLPGAGQLYAGDYKNAINSFLLVGIFVAIGTDMCMRYAWYDSAISIFPWFYRYYQGGYKNAMSIAKKKQKIKRNKKLNEIIKVIGQKK